MARRRPGPPPPPPPLPDWLRAYDPPPSPREAGDDMHSTCIWLRCMLLLLLRGLPQSAAAEDWSGGDGLDADDDEGESCESTMRGAG